MAIVDTINLSKLEGKKRLDAEYYTYQLPHKTVFLSNGFQPLKKFIKEGYRVVYLNTKIIPVEKMAEDDVFFLQAADIDPNVPIIQEEIGGVSYNDWIEYPKGRIKKGELLIEVKGKAEKIALVPDDFPSKTLVSGTLYKITPKKLPGEYLVLYFITDLGKKLRDRLKTNIMVSFINKDDLYDIPIFVPSDELIEYSINSYRNAVNCYNLSKSLYSQAESLLLNELRIPDLNFEYEKYFTFNLSKIAEKKRADSEYFNPVYSKLINHLDLNFELKSLDSLLIDMHKGIEVGSLNYEKEGLKFIRVSNLSIEGIFEKDQKYINEDLFKQLESKFQPKIGEILLTKDASPGIAYLIKEPVEGIISSGLLRLTTDTNKILPEYLTLCINSMIGQLQIERDTGGSVIDHWRPEQIKKLKIPILHYNQQNEISDLLLASYTERKKSEEILNSAKERIESEILEKLNYETF